MIVQITDILPLDILNSIGVKIRQIIIQLFQDRINIQYYAETFLETLLIAESREDVQNFDLIETQAKEEEEQKKKDIEAGLIEAEVARQESEDEDDEIEDENENKEMKIDEDPFRNSDYWIISSNVYVKRENLNNDPSEWKGWEVHARTQKRDIFLILFRRKYLPPLMESYTEMVFALYGPENFTLTQKQAEEHILHKHKKTERRIEDFEALTNALDSMVEEQMLANILRNTVDTLYSERNVQEIYTKIIKMNADALIYDEDSLEFYKNKLKIVPSFIVFGIHLLDAVFIKLKHIDEEHFSSLQLLLSTTYQRQKKEFSDVLPEVALNEENPVALIRLFESASFVKEKKGVETQRIAHWNKKLSRYLAYCFDGGLLGYKFNLKHLIQLIENQSLSLDYKLMLLELIDYFLYAVPDNSQTEFIPGDIGRRLTRIQLAHYTFNERVLYLLLETDFFSNQFLKKEQTQLYSDFMVYLLQGAQNSRLKLNVCRHLISFHSREKGCMNEQIINAFKPLISLLLQIYQSPNRILSAMACVALFNMCTNSKEYKFQILKDNGAHIIVNKLLSKDETLLNYTLKLIFNLMTVVQNIEKFLTLGIIEKLYIILQGIKIKDCYYSLKILTQTCQILRVCLSSDFECKQIEFVLDLLLNVINNLADQFVMDTQDSDALKAEALYVICKICNKNSDFKYLVNEKVVPYVLEIMNQDIAQPLQEKIVLLLCILIKEKKENANKWLDNQPKLTKKLQIYEEQKVSSASFLIAQLREIKSEDKDKEKDQKQKKEEKEKKHHRNKSDKSDGKSTQVKSSQHKSAHSKEKSEKKSSRSKEKKSEVKSGKKSSEQGNKMIIIIKKEKKQQKVQNQVAKKSQKMIEKKIVKIKKYRNT